LEHKTKQIKSYVLPAIVIAQFACTSLWFAGNAVMSDIIREFHLKSSALAYLTSSVQFGFILGTIIFAVFTITDRYAPAKVFLVCAIIGGIANAGIFLGIEKLYQLILLRFFTGFFLAGIYPVGMKIAADYHQKGLGKALGYLVGALVLGTAFPHLIKVLTHSLSWKYVLIFTSCLSILGGLLIGFLVPNGPFRQQNTKMELMAVFKLFKDKKFRAASFGYFGHMWELYTFWAFIPMMLTTYLHLHSNQTLNISLLSFLIIAIGSLSCIFGGYISLKIGSLKTAFYALFISGLCCLFSPFIFYSSPFLFLGFLFLWGMAVVADSPQFSTIIAQSAPEKLKGSALTIVNSLGFSTTIVSIQLVSWLSENYNSTYIYLALAIGPLFGLLTIKKWLN